MKHGDFEYEITGTTYGYAHKVVVIKRISGEWPPDNELIDIADGSKFHFGGRVAKYEDHARVKVYID